MRKTKYTVKYTTGFKKDYKRAIKRGLKIELLEQVVALLERHVDIRAALLDLHRKAAQPVVNRNISDDGGERRASGYHVRLHSEIVLLRRPQSAARRHNYTTGPA